MNQKVVCHISYHNAFDDRIYWKELLALKEAGYTCIHICVGDTEAEYLTPEGITIIHVKSKRLVSNLWANRIVQLLYKRKGVLVTLLEKARSVAADIYHYHDLQINAITKGLKELPWHPKVIYDVHEVWSVVVKEQRKNGILPALKAKIISLTYKYWEIKNAAHCDYIITTDYFTLDYFDKFLPSIPKSIVYNYSFFLPTASVIKEKKYHFIYTGLLSEGRGLINIVRAVSLLVKNFPDVKVLFIGPYDNSNFSIILPKEIADLNLESNIEVKEPVPFTEISSYYKASYVGLGLFHATPKYTTFIPIKLFEYMAFGLPVLFSDHGPSAEIINKANCGLLVNYTDTKAVSTQMARLLTDKKLYNDLSSNGKHHVLHSFNWDKEKFKLFKIYEELFNS